MDDAKLQAFLGSGNERPVIWLLRAHRVLAVLALLLFLAWLAALRGAAWAAAEGPLQWAFFGVLLASLAVKVAARVMDRRAMRKDLALLEETRP